MRMTIIMFHLYQLIFSVSLFHWLFPAIGALIYRENTHTLRISVKRLPDGNLCTLKINYCMIFYFLLMTCTNSAYNYTQIIEAVLPTFTNVGAYILANQNLTATQVISKDCGRTQLWLIQHNIMQYLTLFLKLNLDEQRKIY